jgi:hypothetical protein
VVKSTDCSSKGSEFKSQQPHDGSQPSIMRSEDRYSVHIYNKLKNLINKKIYLKKKKAGESKSRA